MAEAIFKDIARRDGTLELFGVSSAGTKNWDIGLQPDFRARQVLAEANITLDPGKRAQMISDLQRQDADYVIAMTERIAQELGEHENVFLLMDFVEDAPMRDIPDPYPTDTFPEAFQLINCGVKSFYAYLKDKHYDNWRRKSALLEQEAPGK